MGPEFGIGMGREDGSDGKGPPRPSLLIRGTEMAGLGLLVLGLVADRVIEVMALAAAEIEPPPDFGVRWRSDYIAGVGHRESQFVIIFDLPKLFTVAETNAFLQAGSLERFPT